MSKVSEIITSITNTSTPTAQIHHSKSEAFFVPKFSTNKALIELVLSANAIALILTLIPMTTWNSEGIKTLLSNIFFVNWVTFIFAYLVDIMRPQLIERPRREAMIWCVGIFVFITMLFTLLALLIAYFAWSEPLTLSKIFFQLTKHAILSFLFSWVTLHYLYVREQLLIRQHTELHARIEALQSKIRPHFLFNSMNMLRSLISIDTKKAEEAVENLSALFRSSLKAEGEVPMMTEIDLCKRYLALEKLRLGERLEVEWVLPDEDTLYDMNIPSLTLQPILENAVYHGVETRVMPSKIRIYIESIGLEVRIVVTNPVGQGARSSKQSNGIALDNISQRLYGYYGESSRVYVNQSEDVYTTYLFYCEKATKDENMD